MKKQQVMSYSNLCKEICLTSYGNNVSINLTTTRDYEFLNLLPKRIVHCFNLTLFLKKSDNFALQNFENLKCIFNTIPKTHCMLRRAKLSEYDRYAYCIDEENNMFLPEERYTLSCSEIKIPANYIKPIVLLSQNALNGDKFVNEIQSKTTLRIPNKKKYLFNTLNVFLMLHPLTYNIFNNKCIKNTLTNSHIKTYGLEFPEESLKQNGMPLDLEQFQNKPITEELIGNLIKYVTKIIKINSK